MKDKLLKLIQHYGNNAVTLGHYYNGHASFKNAPSWGEWLFSSACP